MFQMGGVGPMFGQVHHFLRAAKEPVPYAIKRYTTEKDRLYGVLNTRLGESEYLAGEYSIADMATYPWCKGHAEKDVGPATHPHFMRWFAAMEARDRRHSLGIRPVYKTVDTCAAEFAARTPYHYSSYDEESEVEPRDRPALSASGPDLVTAGDRNRPGKGRVCHW